MSKTGREVVGYCVRWGLNRGGGAHLALYGLNGIWVYKAGGHWHVFNDWRDAAAEARKRGGRVVKVVRRAKPEAKPRKPVAHSVREGNWRDALVATRVALCDALKEADALRAQVTALQGRGTEQVLANRIATFEVAAQTCEHVCADSASAAGQAVATRCARAIRELAKR